MMAGTMGTWGRAVAAALLVAAPVGAQEVHRLTGSDVAVYNLAGRTRIVAGTGTDVVVRITRGGGDASGLRVEKGTSGGRSTLTVLYPGEQVVYPEMGRTSRTQVRVREDGTFWSGGGGETVEIRGSGRGTEAWADLVIEVPEGTKLAAQVAVGAMTARGVRGDLTLHTGSGAVEVADVAGAVGVDTGSGSVSVSGARGDVRVDTGSGSVTVREVDGAEVSLDTGSGSVRGGGLRARSLTVDTGSGSVDLDALAVPSVRVDTGSGSVRLALLRDVDTLVVDTGSGSVTVHAPQDLGAELDIETGSGGIEFDFEVRARSVRRDRLVGAVGDGRGTIRIESGSGSVKLLRR